MQILKKNKSVNYLTFLEKFVSVKTALDLKQTPKLDTSIFHISRVWLSQKVML